jgi:hypothetical protein
MKSIENYFNTRIQTKKNGAKMRDEQARVQLEMEKRAPKLAEKTLLLRAEWLDRELTEANFKNFYPYKYKICDREFMDNVVMTQDANYAYGVELPLVISSSNRNTVMYLQFVIDASDSQPVCVVKPSTGSMMVGGGITGKAGTRNFTIKTVEKIVEQIKGKK